MCFFQVVGEPDTILQLRRDAIVLYLIWHAHRTRKADTLAVTITHI